MNTIESGSAPTGIRVPGTAGIARVRSEGAASGEGASIASRRPATNHPSRSRASSTPRAPSSSYAACAVFFESPKRCSIARTGGKREPAGKRPAPTSRTIDATMSAALGRRPS